MSKVHSEKKPLVQWQYKQPDFHWHLRSGTNYSIIIRDYWKMKYELRSLHLKRARKKQWLFLICHQLLMPNENRKTFSCALCGAALNFFPPQDLAELTDFNLGRWRPNQATIPPRNATAKNTIPPVK